MSIVHFKGSHVKVSYFLCFSVTDGCFNHHGQGTDGAVGLLMGLFLTELRLDFLIFITNGKL